MSDRCSMTCVCLFWRAAQGSVDAQTGADDDDNVVGNASAQDLYMIVGACAAAVALLALICKYTCTIQTYLFDMYAQSKDWLVGWRHDVVWSSRCGLFMTSLLCRNVIARFIITCVCLIINLRWSRFWFFSHFWWRASLLYHKTWQRALSRSITCGHVLACCAQGWLAEGGRRSSRKRKTRSASGATSTSRADPMTACRVAPPRHVTSRSRTRTCGTKDPDLFELTQPCAFARALCRDVMQIWSIVTYVVGTKCNCTVTNTSAWLLLLFFVDHVSKSRTKSYH